MPQLELELIEGAVDLRTDILVAQLLQAFFQLQAAKGSSPSSTSPSSASI